MPSDQKFLLHILVYDADGHGYFPERLFAYFVVIYDLLELPHLGIK